MLRTPGWETGHRLIRTEWVCAQTFPQNRWSVSPWFRSTLGCSDIRHTSLPFVQENPLFRLIFFSARRHRHCEFFFSPECLCPVLWAWSLVTVRSFCDSVEPTPRRTLPLCVFSGRQPGLFNNLLWGSVSGGVRAQHVSHQTGFWLYMWQTHQPEINSVTAGWYLP